MGKHRWVIRVGDQVCAGTDGDVFLRGLPKPEPTSSTNDQQPINGRSKRNEQRKAKGCNTGGK